MSGYRRAVDTAVSEIGGDQLDVTVAGAWHLEPEFTAAVAGRIREGLRRMAAAGDDDVPVLLTAHSLPRRVADQEPGYIAQLQDTANAIATAAGLRDDQWRFCWQSAGHEPGEWMKPDFADLMPELAAAGHRAVLVAPVQFLADHLEILYDVDIGAREQADAAGMRFARIESLNTDQHFIRALANVAQREAEPARPMIPGSGDRGRWSPQGEGGSRQRRLPEPLSVEEEGESKESGSGRRPVVSGE